MKNKINPKHKEAIITLLTRKEFPVFIDFLKKISDNIAIFEWVRTTYTDPLLREKKAYYQGQRDILKEVINTITQLSDSKDDE
jgi:hypothetical protein